MNPSYNSGTIEQYHGFVDFLHEKSLLTNAISAQIKADLQTLNFKELSPLNLLDLDRQNKIEDRSSQLSPENFTSKNFIRNGKFTQWQYGDAVEYQGSSTPYFADSWFGRRGKYDRNLVVNRIKTSADNDSAMRLCREEGDESIGEIGIAQLVDPAEVANLAGKTVMLAVRVRCGAGYSLIANQLSVTVYCSNDDTKARLNPFTLGKDSQVITTKNIDLTQNWSSYVIYGQIPHTTQKVMVTFRTGDLSSNPAKSDDYFELTDIELKTN